jgi:hypothetical protein
MPLYSIKNVETDEIFEINIPYSGLEQYFSDNPTHKQIFNKFPNMGDPLRLGRVKVDDGFKDVLNKAKKAHIHSTVNTW